MSGWIPAVLTNHYHCSLSGADNNTLTKDSGAAWTAGAFTTFQGLLGDGGVRSTIIETNTARMYGLALAYTTQSYTDIDFAVHLTGTGSLNAYQSGVLDASGIGTYSADDVISVERSGSAVVVKQDTGSGPTTIHTFSNSSSGKLYGSFSLNQNGSTIAEIEMDGAGFRIGRVARYFIDGEHVFEDDFDDNDLDTSLWTATDSGSNVNEQNARLEVTGSSAWNANGVVSKVIPTGTTKLISACDIVTPASIDYGDGCLVGLVQSASLDFQTSPQALLYFHGTFGIRAITSNGACPVMMDMEASTTYNVRITSIGEEYLLMEVKKSADTDWTIIYAWHEPFTAANAYFHFQVYKDTFYLDNVLITGHATPASPHSWDYHFVNIGDSIAYGNQDSSGVTITSALETIFPDIDGLKSGVGGETTSGTLARFDTDAIDENAEKVILTVGTNDYNPSPPVQIATSVANLDAMLALCQAATPAREFIVGEVPAITQRTGGDPTPSGLYKEDYQDWTKRLNAAYREWCAQNGVRLCPSYQEMATHDTGTYEDDISESPDYNHDNTHFNGTGYTRMADLYARANVPTRTWRWGVYALEVCDESWDWWLLGGSAAVSGDADTGTMVVPQDDTADSPVKALVAGAKMVTLSATVSAGTATLQYRTDTANFARDDAASWTTYTAPFRMTDDFLQVRILGASVADAEVDDLTVEWMPTVDLTLGSQYTVKQTPSALTKGLAYLVNGPVNTPLDSQYAVRATAAAITPAIEYRVRTTASPRAPGLQYTIKAPVQITPSSQYTVETTPSAVTKAVTYAVAAPYSVTPTGQYAVKAPVKKTKNLTYTIEGGTTSGITRSSRYAVLATAAATPAAQYTVKVTWQVNPEWDAGWGPDLEGWDGGFRAAYAVETTSAITPGLEYVVVPTGLVQSALTYRVKGTVTADTPTTRYAVETVGHKTTKNLTYSLEQPAQQAITRSLQYAVRQTPGAITPASAYAVRTTPAAASVTAAYAVTITPSALTFSCAYIIEGQGIVTQLSAQYTVVAPVSVGLACRYVLSAEAAVPAITLRVVPEPYILRVMP